MSMSPLRQPLHILRKDARHLWPETLVSIALLVAFAWAAVQSWHPAPADGFDPAAFSAGILRFLIPVSWLVLTSRLVHDEELVGDRQFWTTRPYTWYSLLGAKVLYLLLFVGVPFFAMQAWLLHHAGLYPTLAVPGLLLNLIFIGLVFLLPFVAVAAVTATFIRYASSVLGGFIYVFAIVVFAAYKWSENLAAPGLIYLIGALFVLFPLAALLLQYARRKTLIARLILVALPLVFLVVAVAAPLNLLTAHHYPDTSLGSAAFNTAAPQPSSAGRLLLVDHKLQIDVPVTLDLNHLPDKAYIEVQRVQSTVDGPNGLHYVSGWNATRAFFNPERKFSTLPVILPEAIFNQLHDKSVSLHLTLGVQTMLAGTPYTVTATEKPFPLPGHASCTLDAETGELACRSPFANADLTQVEATVHSGDCLNPGPETATANGILPPNPVPVGFTPVELNRVRFSVGEQRIALCAGTPVTFTPAVAGAFGRIHSDIPSITLDPYAHRIAVRTPSSNQPVPQP